MLTRFHFFVSNSSAVARQTARFFTSSSQARDSKKLALADLFTPYQVKPLGGAYAHRVQFASNILFKLNFSVDYEKLPYSDFYTKEFLAKDNLVRENSTIVVARADARSPEEIFDKGGFHPQATNPDNSYQKSMEEILSVMDHRDFAWGSGLVSATDSMDVACTQPGTKYIYLMKAIGAIGPHPHFYKGECEWSMPAGFDFEAIIAFRSKAYPTPIFISKEFEKNYPDKLPLAIKAYLSTNEVCYVNEVEISHRGDDTPFRPRF